MSADPVITDDAPAHRYEIRVDGALAGFAQYRRSDDTTAFVHTVVEPAFEGRGLGSALARGALDADRAAGRAVLPFCPFIRGWIERHPGYVDLVPAGRRGEFGLA